MELVLISLASLLAGGIDSIVGGGGLILVPALFAVYPTTAPATLFGTCLLYTSDTADDLTLVTICGLLNQRQNK